ncbi:MAG: hypothetical protein A2W91_19160 [Bacteroidetes bacterium GWF2_38_335]|nr:MAG: hypothetical protein A2W91_19160 [Bacteroidetes bacterium GWF2_38_335]OFY79880.1 MAG: hypothetical protein A2281_10560 [Bacteroidetes bacterium RIFOXYA12_FULL_38_20]HBS86334.1 hypothetical protein [Bacteroidales bacterium]
MKKQDSQHINDVIQAYCKSMNIDKKMKEFMVIRIWEEFVGKMVAKATKDIYFHEGTMFVSLKSSIVRNELLMIRTELKKRINEQMGEEMIKEIVLR